MWPPVSLEHEGADWHVADSITPSAINSWIGEEVRPAAAEGSVAALARRSQAARHRGDHGRERYRGNTRSPSAAGRFTTAPRSPSTASRCRRSTTKSPHTRRPSPIRLLDIPSGFARRPGYYAKLDWQPPIPIRLELFRYDNRANPIAVNGDFEWGWRTRFDNIGLVADLGGGAELKGQAIHGTTRMGYAEDGRRWVDNRFRSAFLLFTRPVGAFGLAARVEGFDTRNRGSHVGDEYDDSGWSAMVAGKREWGQLTGLVELLRVSSRRENREDIGIVPRQLQTQLQAELRMRW